jgi:hypothetical protein
MTSIQTISGKLFYEMLVSAANSLENNKHNINDPKDFPYPDADESKSGGEGKGGAPLCNSGGWRIN